MIQCNLNAALVKVAIANHEISFSLQQDDYDAMPMVIGVHAELHRCGQKEGGQKHR